jgi:hypothetical protein
VLRAKNDAGEEKVPVRLMIYHETRVGNTFGAGTGCTNG